MKGVMTPLMPGAEVSQIGTGYRFDPVPHRPYAQSTVSRATPDPNACHECQPHPSMVVTEFSPEVVGL